MSTSPVIDPVPSLATRLWLCASTWLFKSIITTIFGASRLLLPSVYRKYAPTYTKTYPARPTLECRVFIPKAFTSGASLPLYIDIHGGGFIAGDAQLDDKICHYLCNQFNLVVVSISYRLAPSHPFPAPLDDCTELVLEILADSTLPVAPGKVAVGGQSAGGTLAVALSQDNRLQSKINGVFVGYGATDFSHKFTGDYRDKPADANGKGAEPDGLRRVIPLAEWAYIPYGHDRTDPRLSPVYADRKSLPKNIYFVAAQYDKLCEEAFNMARRLAGDDALKEEDDWHVDGIRWERLPNEVHAFIEAGWQGELLGGTPLPWKQETEDVLGRVGGWLDKVYSDAK